MLSRNRHSWLLNSSFALQRLYREFRHFANGWLLFLALVIGTLTAMALWLFHEAIHYAHVLFQEDIGETALAPLGPFGPVLALALAGFVVGQLMDTFVGPEKYHGVTSILESVTVTGGKLPFRQMPAKGLASAISLGAGSSVGPEDPSVQIGSNIGSFVGEKLRIDEDTMRLLVGAGAGAAIAAAFNAPIAGVFFALEVIMGNDLNTRSVSVIIIAAVISSAVSQGLGAENEQLGPFDFTLKSVLEIPLYIPLGLILGALGVLYIRLNDWQADLWHRRLHHLKPRYKVALAGAIVGLIGIYLPEVLGGGRDVMNEVMLGDVRYALGVVFLIAFVKMLVTSLSLSAGFVGGVFAPSLFIGTMIGTGYGQILQDGLGFDIDPRAFAIAGMAGLMAGIVRSPITAIMLVFELTNDYRFILPIMLVTGLAIIVGELYEDNGIYQRALIKDGIHLRDGRDIDLMQSLTVEEAMHRPAATIHEAATLTELRDTLRAQHVKAVCVVDGDGKLAGIVSMSDLQRAYAEDPSCPRPVGEICVRDVITAEPDDVLWSAIRKMGAHNVGRLPVVDGRRNELVGMLNRHDIVQAYNTAIQRKLRDQQRAEQVRLNRLTGAHVYELHVSSKSKVAFCKVSQVQWPPEAVVASILRRGRLVIPHGHTEIMPGDTLSIVADPHAERHLFRLFDVRDGTPDGTPDPAPATTPTPSQG